MKLLHKTRKHSSRMRTALLQTICASVAKTRCCSWGVGGGLSKGLQCASSEQSDLNRSPVLATRCQSGLTDEGIPRSDVGRRPGGGLYSEFQGIMDNGPHLDLSHSLGRRWSRRNIHSATPLGFTACCLVSPSGVHITETLLQNDRQTRLKRLPSGNSVGGR